MYQGRQAAHAKLGNEHLAWSSAQGPVCGWNAPSGPSTSSSLKIHWSMIKAFFRWAVEEKSIGENPLPRRTIKVKKPEVRVPTLAEINRVIDAAQGTDKLFILTMRYAGMALIDTATLSKEQLTDGNLIRGNRTKTHERFRVRIPLSLAQSLLALPGAYPFWQGQGIETLRHNWGKRLGKVFRAAGVEMTSHKFRHFFITEQLSRGRSVEDVSKMVGTSPQEIRKTYEHCIREGEDRLDEAKAQTWLSMGLDADNNAPTVH
jgi:integrase